MKDQLKSIAVNDEGFAFNPRRGDCFRLNSTAQILLKSLKQGKTPEQIAQFISLETQTPELTVLEDIQDFLTQIKIQGLAG
jgi:hypothetical protein